MAQNDDRVVLTGDFDGDGDLDVLARIGSDLHFPWRLLRNDGTGHFEQENDVATRVSSDGPSSQPDLGDADGDGDLDVLIASRDTFLLINDGTGHFANPTDRFPTGLRSGVTNARFLDLEPDGDLDVVAAGLIVQYVFVNDGTGRFTLDTTTRIPKPARIRTSGRCFSTSTGTAMLTSSHRTCTRS